MTLLSLKKALQILEFLSNMLCLTFPFKKLEKVGLNTISGSKFLYCVLTRLVKNSEWILGCLD